MHKCGLASLLLLGSPGFASMFCFFFSNQNTIRPQDLYSLCVACFSFATWLHLGPFDALIYDILPPYPAIAANPSWRLWCREIWGTLVKPRGPLESIRGWIWGHVKLSSQGHNFGFLRNQDNCSSHPIHQRQGLFGCGESLNEHCIRQYLRDMVIWPMSACQKD